MHVYCPRCGSKDTELTRSCSAILGLEPKNDIQMLDFECNHCGYMFVLHDDTFPDKINEENENDNHEKNYK